jgi:hypothetical protein
MVLGVTDHLSPVYAHLSETHVCFIDINICNACLIADVSAAGIKDTRGVPAYTAFNPRAAVQHSAALLVGGTLA